MTLYQQRLPNIKDTFLYKKLHAGYRISLHHFKEVMTYVQAIQKKEPEKKFFIFGQGRTGSTLLCSLLNSHPKIQADYEILFNPVWFPEFYLKSKSQLSKEEVYGFKVKIYQLTGKQKIDNPSQFIHKLIDDNWKLIYLKRNNLLRHVISFQAAKQRNIWHTSKEDTKMYSDKIYINCNSLINGMQMREKYLIQEQNIVEKFDHITISYEDDLLSPKVHQKTVDRICDFFEIERQMVNTELSKTVPSDLSQLIENYDELVSTLRGTKYSHFLD